MVEPTCELMHHWWQTGKIISTLRIDNASKNKRLTSRLASSDWKNPGVIKYTTRDTPQQNSPVEVAFYALANKAHATMHHANLPMDIQYRLFSKSFATVTLLDGLTVIEIEGKCASCYKFCDMLRFVHSLCTVGEAGTVKIKTDTTPKLEDQGVHCMFVGYSLTHPTKCYRMYDPKTHRVHVSQDIVWLHRMYYQKNPKEMGTDQITVAIGTKNPRVSPDLLKWERTFGNDKSRRTLQTKYDRNTYS